jgi:hypothetical protein
MAPKLHPPVPSVKAAQITQSQKQTRKTKINPKIVAYLSHLKKAHPKHHDPPANHHDLTIKSPHQTPAFSQNPLKKHAKNTKNHPTARIRIFFAKPHHPEPHPAAQAADKDTREAACI